jgi:hypothetical protein
VLFVLIVGALAVGLAVGLVLNRIDDPEPPAAGDAKAITVADEQFDEIAEICAALGEGFLPWEERPAIRPQMPSQTRFDTIVAACKENGRAAFDQ